MLYRGLTYEMPLMAPDAFESGVLTACGCFDRHNLPRELELQDNYQHQKLDDDKPETMYDTFKRMNHYYAKKQIFQE